MRFRESANPKLLNSPGLLEMGFVACSVSNYFIFLEKRLNINSYVNNSHTSFCLLDIYKMCTDV